MRLTASTTVLLSALVLAGCSGSSSPSAFRQPAVSDFAAGTCRTVAPDVLSIGKDAQRLGAGGEVKADVLTSLETAQSGIRPPVEAAEPAYKPALPKRGVSVGLGRLHATGGRCRPHAGGGSGSRLGRR